MTMAAVARTVGMTAPGLYRYVAGVDGLLTLLISEGFNDLADRCEKVWDVVPRDDPGGRLVLMAHELRDWAREDVAQYGLIFGSPIPNYAAPEDGPTTVSARRAGGVLQQIVIDAQEDGLLGIPLIPDVEPAVEAAMQMKVIGHESGLAPASQAAIWACLSLLLGSVTDEVFSHTPHFDDAMADAIYRGRIDLALRIVGLPPPRVR
jgi:AcrR family transcriptional regulator